MPVYALSANDINLLNAGPGSINETGPPPICAYWPLGHQNPSIFFGNVLQTRNDCTQRHYTRTRLLNQPAAPLPGARLAVPTVAVDDSMSQTKIHFWRQLLLLCWAMLSIIQGECVSKRDRSGPKRTVLIGPCQLLTLL